MLDRLRRVTDLFIEGAPLHLGMDDANQDVVVWVNKLNSFEVEEARQDGLIARGATVARLTDPTNPERLALEASIAQWSDEDLIGALVNQKGDELYLSVLNDLEADEAWAEKIQMVRRLPMLLEDSNVPADDPRRTQLQDLQSEYMAAVREGQKRAAEEARQQFEGREREELRKEFFTGWAHHKAMDDYVAANKVTQIYYALRDCRGTREHGPDGTVWNHSRCDHSRQLLNERSQVRGLPEQVLERVVDTLEDLTVSLRDSGNSDAPQSSSASVGRPSAPEVSTGSTQEVTSPAVPTT